jgi:hypothetical protein
MKLTPNAASINRSAGAVSHIHWLIVGCTGGAEIVLSSARCQLVTRGWYSRLV